MEDFFGETFGAHDHVDHDAILPLDTHSHDSLTYDSVDPETHLHIKLSSNAVDSDKDGFSDAVETRLGTDPFDPYSHPNVDKSLFNLDASHYLWRRNQDTDADGFSDQVELAIGTNPSDVVSHPDVVLPHHFPEGSDENPLQTIDIKLPPLP